MFLTCQPTAVSNGIKGRKWPIVEFPSSPETGPFASLAKRGNVNARPVDHLSLREMLRDAEQLCRELADHLERGFAHKADILAKLIHSRPGSRVRYDVKDITLHHNTQFVLESDKFTQKLVDRFRELLKAIDASMHEITDGPAI